MSTKEDRLDAIRQQILLAKPYLDNAIDDAIVFRDKIGTCENPAWLDRDNIVERIDAAIENLELVLDALDRHVQRKANGNE